VKIIHLYLSVMFINKRTNAVSKKPNFTPKREYKVQNIYLPPADSEEERFPGKKNVNPFLKIIWRRKTTL
jgi:hypothetical protein